MSDSSPPTAQAIRWRFGVCAALALALLALVPQFHLWAVRGSAWQGSYVSFDFDEVAYSSYLNALIAGRPRRNDPYTGRDDATASPQPESLFSIQCLPAYTLALPARALGLSAAGAFIIARPLAAGAATLALFWLLALITGDSLVAATGAVIVLCLGMLAGEPHGAWRVLTMRSLAEALPFLRRYVPALPFPLFFICAALAWQALHARTRGARLTRAALAGATFALLTFSYFFLWTAAAAWLVVLALLWITARRADRHALSVFGLLGACAVGTLLPYAALLARRAPTMDDAQLLTHSHALQFSLPVLLGLAALLTLIIATRRGRLVWHAPAVLFAASFALLPVIVFNQQLGTGLLLQPVHYGRYIANYVCLLAALLTATLIWRGRAAHKPVPARLLVCATLIVFSWSMSETLVRTHRLAAHNVARDDARRVALRLADRAQHTPDNNINAAAPPVVLCADLSLADALPNVAPQPVLWAQHLFVFAGTTSAENRARLYQQLYYTDVDEQTFAALAGSDSYLRLTLFGWERMNNKPYVPPITPAEVQLEARRYAAYCAAFAPTQVASPSLAYVVVPASNTLQLTKLDRWYTRDSGERIGDFMLYRVRPRP